MTTPILLNSCARAATAAEARYRIDVPIRPSRNTRVVALDDGAEPVVRQVAALAWSAARFFTCAPIPRARPGDGRVADLVLRSTDGNESRLSEQLSEADVAVMVATDDEGARTASVIGDACSLRGIMTAGLVITDGGDANGAVRALRPYARVLLVTRDESDVAELLTALRA